MQPKRAERALGRWLLLLLPALAYLLLDALAQRALSALGLSQEWALLAAESVLALAAWRWYRRLEPRSPRPAVSPARLLLWVGAGLSCALALTLLPTAQESVRPGLIGLLGLGLSAPAAEELVYRGLLLRRGEALVGRAWAVAASAMLFAAGHPRPGQFLAALVFGLFLAMLLIRCKTVLAPLTVHVLVNLFSLLWRRDTVPLLLGLMGALGFVCVCCVLLQEGSEERS